MPRDPLPPSLGGPTPLELDATNLTLTIDGVNRTPMLVKGTLGIADALSGPSTCDFELYDAAGVLDLEAGDVVVLVDSGGARHFAGAISEPGRTPYRTGTLGVRWRVSCLDLSDIPSRHLVARVYDNATAGAIIRDIVAQDLAGEGLTTVNVEDGPVIERAVFNYQPASKCFDDLADLTGYDWLVDYEGDVHFFGRESNLAPIAFTDSSANFRTISVARPRAQYRNRQIVRGGSDVTDPRTEAFVGDGQRRTFTVAFPVVTPPLIRTPGTARELLSFKARENETVVPDLAWERANLNTNNVFTDPVGNNGQAALLVALGAGDLSMRLKLDECPGAIPGESYFFAIGFDATGSTSRDAHVELEWLDEDDLPTGARAVGATLTEFAGYRSYTVTGTAPAGAVKIRPYGFVEDVILGEAHRFDTATLLGEGFPVVGVKGVDPDGSHAWYWQSGSSEITQDNAETVLGTGDTLEVTYRGSVPLIVIAEDSDEIARRAALEGGTGVREAIEENTAIKTASLATERADSLLRKFGRIPHVVTIETDDGYRVAAGQLVNIDVASAGLSGSFLIDSVSGRDAGSHLLYTVRAISGESLGSWVDFFARLAEEGRPFAIGTNETILLLRRIADAIVMGDTLTPDDAPYVDAVIESAVVSFSEVAA